MIEYMKAEEDKEITQFWIDRCLKLEAENSRLQADNEKHYKMYWSVLKHETGEQRMSDTLKRAAAMLLAEANAIEDCHTRGDGDWTGEDEAKASHDAMREVAILLGEEAERMAEQAFFLKAAQAESERYCEQRDNLLRVLQHITCEPINAEYMAQEAIDAIVADEINEANGGAVCRVTANVHSASNHKTD